MHGETRDFGQIANTSEQKPQDEKPKVGRRSFIKQTSAAMTGLALGATEVFGQNPQYRPPERVRPHNPEQKPVEAPNQTEATEVKYGYNRLIVEVPPTMTDTKISSLGADLTTALTGGGYGVHHVEVVVTRNAKEPQYKGAPVLKWEAQSEMIRQPVIKASGKQAFGRAARDVLTGAHGMPGPATPSGEVGASGDGVYHVEGKLVFGAFYDGVSQNLTVHAEHKGGGHWRHTVDTGSEHALVTLNNSERLSEAEQQEAALVFLLKTRKGQLSTLSKIADQFKRDEARRTIDGVGSSTTEQSDEAQGNRRVRPRN